MQTRVHCACVQLRCIHVLYALARACVCVCVCVQAARRLACTAQVLNEVGRTWEAVQAASTAAELLPHWPAARLTLARVQMNLGEPAIAVASYR